MIPALLWVILFLPLVAAVVIGFGTQNHRGLSAKLSIGAILGSFVGTLLLIGLVGWQKVPRESMVTWLDVGALQVDFGVRLDGLSLMMLLIVTGVGAAIHVYSYGYMHEDRSMPRYFASLSLFTFSMLGIVLANNFLQLFIFWELVGLSSYLLIGFWYERPAAADACKKAFLTNRIGDFGFLLGILLVWAAAGSLNFSVLEGEMKQNSELLGLWATAAGLLIFCGAMGKSAQFPLHVWLPDAMEGPTPVSALIHAATMVAAGVYMLCRVFFLLNGSALVVIAWIGGVTALLAAIIAIQQNDIKRILAYSTLSQLGLMVMAVGLSGPESAMYHLTTHAFFKALLFLGAGSVIHALHHEQDIWRMGGLRRTMPITFWTFLLGTLALCGVPPFSGFFSKDEVLLQASHENPVLFGVAVLVSVLTTFYMFRLFVVAFLGRDRSEGHGQIHESPLVMTLPLVVLSVPAVLGGFWGLEGIFGEQLGTGEVGHGASGLAHVFAAFNHPLPALGGVAAILFGGFAAWGLYANADRDPLPEKLGMVARVIRNRFYFDEIYGFIIQMTQETLASLAQGIDRWLISGFVIRGIQGTTDLVGRTLRLVQTGNLQTYAFLFVAGVALVLFLVIGR